MRKHDKLHKNFFWILILSEDRKAVTVTLIGKPVIHIFLRHSWARDDMMGHCRIDIGKIKKNQREEPEIGSEGRTWTADLRIMIPLL